MRYFLNVRYTEPDQASYEAIEISEMGKPANEITIEFNSGDLCVDYIDYLKWFPEGSSVAYSSSFDHVLMDGDIYREIYVDHDNQDKVVSFEGFMNISTSGLDKLARYIARPHIKTFEDLKNFYIQKKKLSTK